MISKRIYILNTNFDNTKNGVYDISNFNVEKYKYKVGKINKITKKTYLNINQELNHDTNDIRTYCEYYKVLFQKDNKIVMEYKRDKLDDLEFPPLNKYDFEETYEQKYYITEYGIIISNKYQTYLEIDDDIKYENYDEILNIF